MRLPVLIINHAAGGRNYFAGVEFRFVVQGKGNELLQFLWRQELIQHNTLRGQSFGTVKNFYLALRKAGVDYELVTYEGAPHSFFDRKQEDFAAASEDAWTRVLAFIAARS